MPGVLHIAGVGVATPLGAGGVEFLRGLPALCDTHAANGAAHPPTATRAPATLLATLEQRYRPGFLRRLDRCAQLALLAATQALEDARLEPPLGERWGLLVGSGNGPTASVQALFASIAPAADGRLLCSPTAFSNSLHNAAAAHIGSAFGIQGPCLTVSQLEESVPAVLELAALLLATQPALAGVLVGCVDEGIPLSGAGPGSSSPGEGASFFVCQAPTKGSWRWTVEVLRRRAEGDSPPGLWAIGAQGHGAEPALSRAFAPPSRQLGNHPTGAALDLALALALLGQTPAPGGPARGPLGPLAAALGAAEAAELAQDLEDGTRFRAVVRRKEGRTRRKGE